ncbi:uncharacterized protein LOC118437069 isoform X2 [Folsomia candida]|uniref:uncharacterized protein LOC118437069 isoform X2 n=1 Tax=Folsomia candida TaxID=158441 RepID=UPI001604B6E7|nr:uncharacterized protein LOC118437069 isoform X2 [Folsomia candida]
MIYTATGGYPSLTYHVTSGRWGYTRISLTGDRRGNEICGKLKITRPIRDQIPESDEWDHYALVIEFHGQTTTMDSSGRKCQIPLAQLAPEENSEFICHSRLFALLSGAESGLKKGEGPFVPTKLRNPPSFPFKIRLPENHELQLPATILYHVDFFLVLYLRTEQHGYKIITARSLPRFRGHNLISFQNTWESLRWTKTTKNVTIEVTSPHKFYTFWPKRPILVKLTVTFTQENCSGTEIPVLFEVSVVQRIFSRRIKVRETVIDAKSEENPVNSLKLTYRAHLNEPKYRIGDDDKMLVASFNQNPGEEEGLKIRHYLKFNVVFPLDSSYPRNLGGEEEIFCATGTLDIEHDTSRTGTQGDQRPGLFARMRSQSVSSLFPPSYSRVPSRRGSLISMETLPPHYDDILELEEKLKTLNDRNLS